MKSLLFLLTVLPLAFSQNQTLIRTPCKCPEVECPDIEPDVRIDFGIALFQTTACRRGEYLDQDANHQFRFLRAANVRIELLLNVASCVIYFLRSGSAHSTASRGDRAQPQRSWAHLFLDLRGVACS